MLLSLNPELINRVAKDLYPGIDWVLYKAFGGKSFELCGSKAGFGHLIKISATKMGFSVWFLSLEAHYLQTPNEVFQWLEDCLKLVTPTSVNP